MDNTVSYYMKSMSKYIECKFHSYICKKRSCTYCGMKARESVFVQENNSSWRKRDSANAIPFFTISARFTSPFTKALNGKPSVALAKSGPEGRIRTSVGKFPTDLQSVAIGHSATSGIVFFLLLLFTVTHFSVSIIA